MNLENKFQTLEHENSNAVVSFDNGTTFKVSKLMEQLNIFFRSLVLNDLSGKLKQVELGNTPIYLNHFQYRLQICSKFAKLLCTLMRT